jgi:hypothetical protein
MNELRYANNENGNIIHISEVNIENRYNTKYYCIGCEAELITKLGEIKEHHFCHKVKCECNGETYLHKTAKTLFYNKYIECLEKKQPFKIEYTTNKTCKINNKCKESVNAKFDLTTHFDLIKLEKKDSDFIPDVLLYSSKSENKIYIEMKVTHKCSDKKLNSKNKIIEFNIKTESDFNFKNYEFFNFDFKEIEKKCNCNAKHSIFIVYNDNKIWFKLVKPLQFNSKNCNYYEFIKENSLFYSVIYNRQKQRKINVKSCILCKFSKLTDKQDLYCNIKKGKLTFVDSLNFASECKSFFCDTTKLFEEKYMNYNK